jgi:hypothetical protein
MNRSISPPADQQHDQLVKLARRGLSSPVLNLKCTKKYTPVSPSHAPSRLLPPCTILVEKTFGFSPTEVKVPAGTTIIWRPALGTTFSFSPLANKFIS